MAQPTSTAMSTTDTIHVTVITDLSLSGAKSLFTTFTAMRREMAAAIGVQVITTLTMNMRCQAIAVVATMVAITGATTVETTVTIRQELPSRLDLRR